jgi:hypothetical protein
MDQLFCMIGRSVPEGSRHHVDTMNVPNANWAIYIHNCSLVHVQPRAFWRQKFLLQMICQGPLHKSREHSSNQKTARYLYHYVQKDPVEIIGKRYTPASRSRYRLLQVPWVKKLSWVLRVLVVKLESSSALARRPRVMLAPAEQLLILTLPPSRNKVGLSHELPLSYWFTESLLSRQENAQIQSQ